MRQRGLPNDYDTDSAAALQKKALDGGSDAIELLAAYLNLWEMLGNGVRFDVLDMSVIDRGFGRRLVILEFRTFEDRLR